MPQATQPHYGRPATGRDTRASRRPTTARRRRSIARILLGRRTPGPAGPSRRR